MIRAVHEKLNACGDLAELPDDQPVAVPLVQMGNMAFKIRIRDVGKVSDQNARVCDCRFYIDLPVIAWDRVYYVGIRTLSVSHWKLPPVRFVQKPLCATRLCRIWWCTQEPRSARRSGSGSAWLCPAVLGISPEVDRFDPGDPPLIVHLHGGPDAARFPFQIETAVLHEQLPVLHVPETLLPPLFSTCSFFRYLQKCQRL